MKKIFAMCAMAVAAIACQKQDAFTPSELVETSFSVGVPTKTAMDPDGGMTWKDSDELSVFTDTDAADHRTNYMFTVKSLSGAAENAVFTGKVAANSQRSAVCAIYPYSASHDGNTELSAKTVNISYPITDKWLYLRLKMAGKGTVSGNDFSQTSLHMQQLTWVWDITIANPEHKSIASVELRASEEIFPNEGNLDFTADCLAVESTKYNSSLVYNFSDVQTGESVLARFPIFPMEAHADVDLDVIVRFADGAKEIFSRKAPAKATEAGKRYHNTYTLGEGIYDDMPDDYRLVKSGEDLRAILNNRMNSENYKEVKLYLESSPTEAFSYSLGKNRIYPTKSIYIRSNPKNVRPVISVGSGNTFDINSECSIPCISLKNVEITTSTSANSSFCYISSNNGKLNTLELENCVLNNYKRALFTTLTTDAAMTGIACDNIIVNNCIMRWATRDNPSVAFIQIENNEDAVPNISVTNSTFERAIYLIDCKMTSGSVNYVIRNNTFVNSVAVSDGYFVTISSDSLSGTVDVSSNLFGGTMDQTKFNMLRVGNENPSEMISTSYSDNYATSEWREKFTHSGKNGSVDIVTKTATNAEVFNDLANFDLTLKSGTTAYGANAGDPRWLTTSSAGLGDLEIEDTEY